MTGDPERTTKLAVLIDADNTRPSITEALLAEIATFGTAHVKRAYGDWTGTTLKGWKEQLPAQSIQPIQQFAYTTGKNATDSALIIDEMDLCRNHPRDDRIREMPRRRVALAFEVAGPSTRRAKTRFCPCEADSMPGFSDCSSFDWSSGSGGGGVSSPAIIPVSAGRCSGTSGLSETAGREGGYVRTGAVSGRIDVSGAATSCGALGRVPVVGGWAGRWRRSSSGRTGRPCHGRGPVIISGTIAGVMSGVCAASALGTGDSRATGYRAKVSGIGPSLRAPLRRRSRTSP